LAGHGRVWARLARAASWAALVFIVCLPIASAAPTPGGDGDGGRPSADVRLRDQIIFSIHAERAGATPEQRARAASAALSAALDDPDAPSARLEEQRGAAVVFVGKSPIVTLTDDDAVAAGGEAPLPVYAADVVAKIDGALRGERRRSALAEHVFSISLLVFSGVLAFVVFRRVSQLSRMARQWVRTNPERVPALRLGKIEVARPAAVRTAVSVGLAVAHRAAEFAIAYSWLIFALSRFDATRAYTDRLAGFVLVPLSALLGRLGAALPLVVVAGLAALAVGIAVRFADLFFAGVSRGETHVAWLPRDLARPTSLLIRAGIVLCSLVLAAPLITGSDDGALSRAGVVALVALGLACTPTLACAAAGIPIVFGRRLSRGSFVEAAGCEGIVRDVTFLEIVLEDAAGCEVRVPQLLGLWHVTKVLGPGPFASVEIVVDPRVRPARVQQALHEGAASACGPLRIEMISIDVDGARWRVSGIPKRADPPVLFADVIVEAVGKAGIGLGRIRPTPPG